ncbi:jg9220 [Pararge aegeria aegeria]|uniref:Jg9220 protein n=1 Tax=Pararge aegeria aegeria TaxID=348720 RepID=A0A8S4SEQ3_9NEOP|nr:jg9220 [Pararge aegeria aegeria]
MSVFGDFQRVWVQRFPESALPAAWEEDVRANLAKHKQKVAILREELEKEEFYVEYLETLLSDVEKHKAIQGSRTEPPLGADSNDDKASDSKQDCDSLSKKSEGSLKSDDSIEALECEEVHLRSKSVNFAERSSVNQCINELSSNLAAEVRKRCNSEIVQRTDIASNDIETTNKTQNKTRPASQAGDFVTVIEVNGLKAAGNAAKKSDDSPQSSESSSAEATSSSKKKVPPKPPPKVFNKRGASLPETGLVEDSPPSPIGRRLRNAESRESIGSRASTPSISERVKSYESINSLSSERKRSGGAATPRSIDEEVTSTTPDLPDASDDKSAPISLESIPAAVPSTEDEPYYDQVPVDINDGEYVYIQAGGAGSSTEDGSSGTSTLPLSTCTASAPPAPDSPLCATAPNYVNIHYFIQQAGEGTEPSETSSELADSSDTPLLLRTISSDTEAGATPPVLRKLQHQVTLRRRPCLDI